MTVQTLFSNHNSVFLQSTTPYLYTSIMKMTTVVVKKYCLQEATKVIYININVANTMCLHCSFSWTLIQKYNRENIIEK